MSVFRQDVALAMDMDVDGWVGCGCGWSVWLWMRMGMTNPISPPRSPAWPSRPPRWGRRCQSRLRSLRPSPAAAGSPDKGSDHKDETKQEENAHRVTFVNPAAGPAGDSKEKLESKVGDVSQGERILAVEVDSLNSDEIVRKVFAGEKKPVSLAGPSGSCKGVDDQGDELHGNFHDSVEQAPLLLGKRLRVVNVIGKVFRCWSGTKLPCILLCWIPAQLLKNLCFTKDERTHLFCGRE